MKITILLSICLLANGCINAADTADVEKHTSLSAVKSFDQLVDEFKQVAAITTAEPEKKELFLNFLLKNQVVMQHIQRPSTNVVFDGTGPTTCSEQEVWLYKELLTLDIWTYRGCIGNAPFTAEERGRPHLGRFEGFYDTGDQMHELLLRIAKEAINHEVVSLSEECLDVYQTAETICKYDLFGGITSAYGAEPKKLDTRVLLTPQYNRDHASLILHILDAARSRVLLSVFINSSQDPTYYSKYISEIFFREHMIINPAKINAGLRHLDIGALNPMGFVPVKRKVPLIDASHNLQIASDDRNCGFYAYNFYMAVSDMTKNVEIAGRIFTLAEEIEEQVASTSNAPVASVNALKLIVQNELKGFLPGYYDATGTPRSEAELKAFHMGQRWGISGTRIALFAATGE